MARAVLGLDNGAFHYGVTAAFEGVTLLLDDQRTALVGDNGAGKSTLLKCLTGELELTSGTLVRSRGFKLGYVPQETPEGLADLTVRAVLERALIAQDGSEDWKIDVLLDDYAIAAEIAAQRFGDLSGGWQRLFLIAAAIRLGEPDLLILDEPTNYLDLANINTLERWLAADAKLPLLVVSHDREFLERNTARTVFLRSDGAHAFNATFIAARQQLLQRDAADAQRRALEGKEIARLEKVAARYKQWGVFNDKFDKRRKATEKRIERLEAEKTESYAARERRLELHDGEMDAKAALRLRDLAVTVPDGSRKLFQVDALTIATGDRIAVLGANGAGKSMLLNAIAGAFVPGLEHYDGQAAIRFNPAVRLVHFDQRMRDLPLKTSLLEYVSEAEGVTSKAAMGLLAKAGFLHARITAPIATLSHGERARLIFLKMRLMRPNFYLLDEPTNHLDIAGQEALEEQLEDSGVTCLFVSHDRYFTRTAATRFLEVRKGRLVEIDGAEDFFARQ
jgi:ATPase subunit of ABC transporter with duplicated ATPase domains